MRTNLLTKKSAHVGLYSSLLLIILAPTSVFIHETGHMLVCASEGHIYTMDVNIFGGMLHCSNNTSNNFVFLSFGGVFAMIILSVPLALKKLRRPYVVIPLVSLIIGHGVNALVEVFLNNWYLENMAAATIMINAVMICVFLAAWKKATS